MKATLSSIPFMANLKTRLVHFLLLPLINTLLLVLVDYQFQRVFSWEVPIAAALVSGALLAVNAVTASFTNDRNLKIDREVLFKAPFSMYYWGTKLCVAGLLSLLLTIMQLLILLLVSGGAAPIGIALLLAPRMVLSGLVVGFVCAVVAWRLSDPYRISNLVSTFGYLLSGAVIVVDKYPLWLQIPSSLFPFAHIIAIVQAKATPPACNVSTLFWMIGGILIYIIQVVAMRKKPNVSVFS